MDPGIIVPNKMNPKQMLTCVKEEIDTNTIILLAVQYPSFSKGYISRQKFNKETCFLNYLLVVYNKYL